MHKLKFDPFVALLSLSLILMAGAFFFHQVCGFDIWLHLKTGEYILSHRQIPKQDIYSHTVPGKDWVAHEWLFQVAAFILFKLWGAAGLIAMKVAVVLPAFLLVFKIGRRPHNYLLRATILFLAILVAQERSLVRPEIFSFLFTGAFLFILYSYQYEDRDFLWLLPIIQLLWANLHGYFIIGPVLILAALLGELIAWKARLPFEWNRPDCLKDARYKRLAWMGLLVIFVCAINPNGLRGALYPLKTLLQMKTGAKEAFITIGELTSPLEALIQGPLINDRTVFYFIIFVWIGILSFLLNFKRLNVSRLLIFAGILHLSYAARRNVAIFALMAASVIVLNLREIWEDGFSTTCRMWKKAWAKGFLKLVRYPSSSPSSLGEEGRPFVSHSTSGEDGRPACCLPADQPGADRGGGVVFSRFLRPAAVILIVCASIWCTYLLVSNKYPGRSYGKRFGLGLDERHQPKRAMDFADGVGLKGNVFNPFNFGSYIVWRYYPRGRVFIDGRTEVYGPQTFKRHLGLIKYPAIWDDLMEYYRYHNDWAILPHISSVFEPLISELYKMENWHLVYFDDLAVIFVKAGPQNQQIVEGHCINLKSLLKEQAMDLVVDEGSLFGLDGDERVPIFFNRRLPHEIAKSQFHFERGTFFLTLGFFDLAESELKAALKLEPDRADGHNSLGVVLYERGLFREAIEATQRAIEINPEFAGAHNNLGTFYSKLGDQEKALEQWKRALKCDPQFKLAESNLTLMAERGEVMKKRAELQMQINDFPQDPLARYELGELYYKELNQANDSISELNLANDSISELKQAIRLDPKAAKPKLLLAQIYHKIGFPELGEKYL